MGTVFNNGLIVPVFLGCGRKIKLVGMDNFIMLMEMFIMEKYKIFLNLFSGKMIELMDKVIINMLTVLNITVIGKMIYKMVREQKHGLMVLDTMDVIKMEKKYIF